MYIDEDINPMNYFVWREQIMTLESTLGVCGLSRVENKDYKMIIQGQDQLPSSGTY